MLHDVRQLFVLVAVCAGLLVVSCNDDKPTEPDPEKEYIFYFSNGVTETKYYRYFTASTKGDSIELPYTSGEGFAVSATGDFLYLSDSGRTVVVSTDSLKAVTTFPYEGRIEVSPDNRFIAVLGKDTYILNVHDYSVYFQDTVWALSGAFDQTSQWLYYSPNGALLRVELDGSPDLDTVFTSVGFSSGIRPLPTARKLFLYWRPLTGTFDFLFNVYNTQADSIIFSRFVTPGNGDLEMTPDGRLAFFTNPGSILWGPPPGAMMVFDIDSNAVIDSVIPPSTVNFALLPDKLAITPDGRFLAIGAGGGAGEYAILSVETMEIVDTQYLGNQVILWDVTCQNSL